MRIAQANLNDEGGAFSFVYQIEKQLNGKEQFDYYTILPFGKKEIIENIETMNGRIYELGFHTRFLSNLLLPFRFFKTMKKRKYEVIHVHSDTAWKLSLYAIPAKLAGVKKVIVHSHSSGVNGDFLWIKKCMHLLMRMILPLFSDEMLACSDKAKKWMYPKRYYNKAQVIKCGVDLEKYEFKYDKRLQFRNLLNIKENEILMIVVGNLSYQKNPQFIIDVFDEICAIKSNYTLLLLGDGKDRQIVEKYARTKRSSEHIFFRGSVQNVEDFLNAADIFFMPSRFEGLPVSAIEAEANGMTCIFSDTITREIEMFDECNPISKCYFWSIKDEPKAWAAQIISINYCFSINDRLSGKRVAKNNGFDIMDIANKIDKMYSIGD